MFATINRATNLRPSGQRPPGQRLLQGVRGKHLLKYCFFVWIFKRLLFLLIFFFELPFEFGNLIPSEYLKLDLFEEGLNYLLNDCIFGLVRVEYTVNTVLWLRNNMSN